MQPFPQGHGRSFRVASVLLALLVLLAVVAFASRTGFGHASNTTPTPSYVNWAMSVVLVVLVAMTPVAIWAYVRQTREKLEQGRQRSFQMRVIRGLAVVFLLGVFFLVRVYLRNHLHFGQGLHDLFFGNRHAAGRGKHGTGADAYKPTFQWPVLWASIIALVAAVGAWFWWSKTARPPLSRMSVPHRWRPTSPRRSAMRSTTSNPSRTRAER